MIFDKTDKYGLEVPVGNMQTVIDSELIWLGTNNIYGIIFKNKQKDGVVPEAWIGTGIKGREYTQVFNDDKTTSQIGFLPLERDLTTRLALVQIIVTIDIEKAYDSNIRDNERAYLEVQNIVRVHHNIKEDSFKQGIEDVFKGFKIDNIKYLDQQPFDCFSFDVYMAYPNNLPCTPLT